MKYANTVKSSAAWALPLFIVALAACGTASVTVNEPGASSAEQPGFPASQTAAALGTATANTPNMPVQNANAPAPTSQAGSTGTGSPANSNALQGAQANPNAPLSAFWGLADADDATSDGGSPAVVLLLSSNANWCSDAASGKLKRGSKDTFTLVEDLTKSPTAATKVYGLTFYQVTRTQTSASKPNECANMSTLLPANNPIAGVTFSVAAGAPSAKTLSGTLTLPNSQALGSTQVPVAASLCQVLVDVYAKSMAGTPVSYACGS